MNLAKINALYWCWCSFQYATDQGELTQSNLWRTIVRANFLKRCLAMMQQFQLNVIVRKYEVWYTKQYFDKDLIYDNLTIS